MRIQSDYLTVQTKQKREFMNITPNVKEAAEKSGIRDGLVLISSLHSNSGILINDEEPGLLQDIDEWAESPGAAQRPIPSSSAQREQCQRAPADSPAESSSHRFGR